MSSFVKAATSEDDRRRLRHEAAVLAKAAHPGVITVGSFRDDLQRTELRLHRVHGSTLAEMPPEDPRDALRLCAALARTLADVHSLGIAHGALRPEHVLVTEAHRPVLCGFGDAIEGASDADRENDAAALASLIEFVAAMVATTDRRDSRHATKALVRLARDCRAASPPLTPFEVARRAGTSVANGAARRNSFLLAARSGTRRIAAFALAPAVVLVSLVVVVARDDRGDNRLLATSPPTPPPVPSMAPPRFTAGESTYEAGVAGDQWSVGDWNCTGEPSVLLLRPSTGAIWLFATLPAAEETIEARHVATFVGATDIVGAVSEPCPRIVVSDASGARHEVHR